MQTRPAGAAPCAQPAQPQEDFASVWREAIELLGERFFILSRPLYQCATLEEMRPKVDMIRTHLTFMPTPWKILAHCLLQFHSEQIAWLDRPSVVDLAIRVDDEHRALIFRLISAYSARGAA